MRTGNEAYWPIEWNELRTLSEKECFVCMFSGGKDCGLALALALQHGVLHELVHCMDERTCQSVWHQQSQAVVKGQAEVIPAEIRFVTFSAWERRTALVKLYQRYASQGVKSIVFGDLYEEKQAKLQAALCLSAGLIPRMPLWRRSFKEIIELYDVHEIFSIITCIESDRIGSEWLGKRFNQETFQYFEALGLDPLGEQGEFHTTLVDAGYFERPLDYRLGDTEKIENVRRMNILV